MNLRCAAHRWRSRRRVAGAAAGPVTARMEKRGGNRLMTEDGREGGNRLMTEDGREGNRLMTEDDREGVTD